MLVFIEKQLDYRLEQHNEQYLTDENNQLAHDQAPSVKPVLLCI
jgi:hypothetical protein